MAIRCFECQSPAVHNHHVIPKSRGGQRTIPLCEKCHQKAHNASARKLSEEGRARIKKAGKCYGNVPYGFKVGKNDKLVPHRKEQQTIRTMCRHWKAGKTVIQIQKLLTARGYRNRRGQPFHKTSITRIIRRNCNGHSDRTRRT